MGAIIALIIIVAVSLLTVRVGAVALMMTGLSWDAASFQAYSTFFGVGFTTREAEMVVNHPVRRKIILFLIVVGNVGITSVLATLVVTFVHIDTNSPHAIFQTLGWIALGGAVLLVMSRVRVLLRVVDLLIRRALREAGVLRVLDYELLLRVRSGYCISEVEAPADNPLVGRELGDSRPADQGIIVLGITKKGGRFLGAPGRQEMIEPGDVLTVYGKEEDVVRLARAWTPDEDAPRSSRAEAGNR
ncbi:MAG TPA: TrkA C-terminal domain-containing protein [Verrucomicrobiales bacterium]|nr:TrkA C-terminal domain-containing protein [Verrucomicrobiales bacterium]